MQILNLHMLQVFHELLSISIINSRSLSFVLGNKIFDYFIAITFY